MIFFSVDTYKSGALSSQFTQRFSSSMQVLSEIRFLDEWKKKSPPYVGVEDVCVSEKTQTLSCPCIQLASWIWMIRNMMWCNRLPGPPSNKYDTLFRLKLKQYSVIFRTSGRIVKTCYCPPHPTNSTPPGFIRFQSVVSDVFYVTTVVTHAYHRPFSVYHPPWFPSFSPLSLIARMQQREVAATVWSQLTSSVINCESSSETQLVYFVWTKLKIMKLV